MEGSVKKRKMVSNYLSRLKCQEQRKGGRNDTRKQGGKKVIK